MNVALARAAMSAVSFRMGLHGNLIQALTVSMAPLFAHVKAGLVDANSPPHDLIAGPRELLEGLTDAQRHEAASVAFSLAGMLVATEWPWIGSMGLPSMRANAPRNAES